MMAGHSQGDEDPSLVRMCVLVSATIIIANFCIGIFSPILDDLEDEIYFLDTLWRVVLGQRVGIDYHNPLGFGPYELGALLWHWLGPHYYVMRLSIALFSFAIAFCGCIVAKRTLARRRGLALLFCVTLAFQLSAPTAYAFSPTNLTMAEFFNRQIASALAVLFLQTFSSSGVLKPRWESALDVALAAFLLNVLFLIKISGFLLGLMILLAGCLLRDRAAQGLLKLCAALIAFTAVTVIEFKVTGLKFLPIIRDYEFAAHARLAYSLNDIFRSIISWPFAISMALLVLFAVSRRPGEKRLDFRHIGLIIMSYAGCQLALNLTNSGSPSMWLAPAATASLVCCMGVKPAAHRAGGSENWWWKFGPSQLAEISAREAIPLLIFVLVLISEIIASIFGTAVGALVSLGIEVPQVVTAGRGVSFRSLPRPGHDSPVYVKSLNNAVTAIASLNLGHEVIANLDFSNPFPVLFLAPPPKGIHSWLEWGYNVPRGAVLQWQEVIGDACVVTIPVKPSVPDVTARLRDMLQSKLATDFEIVFEDEWWSIYRRTWGCESAPPL